MTEVHQWLAPALAALWLSAIPVTVTAHHSVAGFFDPGTQVEIEGTVSVARWRNPSYGVRSRGDGSLWGKRRHGRLNQAPLAFCAVVGWRASLFRLETRCGSWATRPCDSTMRCSPGICS